MNVCKTLPVFPPCWVECCLEPSLEAHPRYLVQSLGYSSSCVLPSPSASSIHCRYPLQTSTPPQITPLNLVFTPEHLHPECLENIKKRELNEFTIHFYVNILMYIIFTALFKLMSTFLLVRHLKTQWQMVNNNKDLWQKNLNVKRTAVIYIIRS